jgi:hypothetical protein
LREIDRQIGTWNTIFLKPGAVVQSNPSPSIDPITISNVVLPASEELIKVGVREELLRGWLGERLIDRCIHIQGRLSMSQVQQIVDSLVPDVPLEILSETDHLTVAVGSAPVIPRAAEKTAATKKSARAPTVAESKNAAERDGVEIKVIDRDSFALELAREWVRTGLPRNPAL